MPEKRNPQLPDSRRIRGFTLIEVCLVVAIIAMMILIIVGYVLARRNPVASPAYVLPPAVATPEPKSTPAPAMKAPRTIDLLPPAPPPAHAPGTEPAPATPPPAPILR